MITPYCYNARPSHVVDGDTVDVEIDLGFRAKMTQRLRLAGIDAPEMHAMKDGHPDMPTRMAANDARMALLNKLFMAPDSLRIQTTKTDDFGRYLADLFIGERHINQEMIDEGHAVPYKAGG